MVEPVVTVRVATIDDVDAMAEVDRRSWPSALATTAEQFAARIAAYAGGQLVATLGERIVATAAGQRITQEFLAANGRSYERITDAGRFTQSHDPAGEVYQLIGVGVLPDSRGRQLGRLLVDRQIDFARSLKEIRRIIGFTRPVHYDRHAEMVIEDYVQYRGADGRLLDPVLAFHADAGARIVSVQKDFRPADGDACGYGVLIEYPVE